VANLTLSIDEHALSRARKAAADRHTTVNALVRDYIGRLANEITPDQQAAIDRMLARSAANAGRRIGPLSTREEIHANASTAGCENATQPRPH